MSRDENVLGASGERMLIEMIRGRADNAGVDFPGLYPGDDACILGIGGETMALTTDSIWLDTHIPKGAEGWFAGWYLAAVNLSDLAAMAAKPLGLLFIIAAPKDAEVTWLGEFVDGLCACLEKYGAKLLGGDTKEGPGVFSATAIGMCLQGRCTPRSGVRPGDNIGITGNVGSRAAMLRMGQWDESLHVTPRTKEALAASEAGVGAAVDTSDSLALALHCLSEASNVRIDIDRDRVPIDPIVAKAFGGQEIAWGLGGDFELVVSFPPEKRENVEKAFATNGAKFTTIGQASEGKSVWVNDGKASIPLQKMGYEHFKSGQVNNGKEQA